MLNANEIKLNIFWLIYQILIIPKKGPMALERIHGKRDKS